MEEVLERVNTKVMKAIFSLPEEPITWVCYNNDMIGYYENLIREVKGSEFFDKYVKVISISGEKNNSKLYFDPTLHDLMGNGYE
jgi:hypothetical protein